jgi:hypothetical protein
MLISFRGQRIDVSIYPEEEDKDLYRLVVTSDNVDPGVDEKSRSNKKNVRKFVEAWAFFPGHAVLAD